MKLAVDPVIVLVHELDSMTKIAMHESIAIWYTSITHQHHELMYRLRILGQIVPECGAVVGMGEVSLWITLLGMNEMRELGRISQEEDGSIVGDDIPIAFLSSHLNGKAPWITGKIVRAGFATNSRETNGDGTSLLFGTEDVGRTQVIERIGADEFTVCTTTLCMDDSFWNTLTIEMGDEINQVAALVSENTRIRGRLGLTSLEAGEDHFRPFAVSHKDEALERHCW